MWISYFIFLIIQMHVTVVYPFLLMDIVITWELCKVKRKREIVQCHWILVGLFGLPGVWKPKLKWKNNLCGPRKWGEVSLGLHAPRSDIIVCVSLFHWGARERERVKSRTKAPRYRQIEDMSITHLIRACVISQANDTYYDLILTSAHLRSSLYPSATESFVPHSVQK